MKIPRRDMVSWFALFSILGLLATAILLFLSHGELFNIIFFSDSKDTGMDFFHSMEYVRGREPYNRFNTLYPPLANALFYILYRFIPSWQYKAWADNFYDGIAARGTSVDLRVWQPTLLMFIVFLIFTAVLFVFLIQKFFPRNNNAGMLTAFFSLFSYGMLYCYERGNITVIALLCVLFFVKYRDSSNRLLEEFALIALAFGAGLKLYPAFFGMMLIYDGQYKKALRAIIYGILFFVLPVFIFREGISGLSAFLKILTTYSAAPAFSAKGYSFDRIINALLEFVFCFTGSNDAIRAFCQAVLPKFNIIVSGLTLASGFFLKRPWQKLLACTLAILLFQSQYIYVTVFLLIPLIVMMSDEKVPLRRNRIPFFALVLCVILLPIPDKKEWGLSPLFLRFQICISILLVNLIIEAGNGMLCKFKSGGLRPPHIHLRSS